MGKPRLPDSVRAVARRRHLGLRAERACPDWLERFVLSHDKRHPKETGAGEVRRFLPRLATEGRVSASTQTVALCAPLFLYRDVLRVDPPHVEGVERAQRPARRPSRFGINSEG
jgi:hypothetical protein